MHIFNQLPLFNTYSLYLFCNQFVLKLQKNRYSTQQNLMPTLPTILLAVGKEQGQGELNWGALMKVF